MKNFHLIRDGIDVSGLLAQIEAHPELWDENKERTRNALSPHYGIPDIWVRWRAREELNCPADFNDPHFAVFYPSWHLLTCLHPIVFDLMARVRATYLGAIFLTKIKPGFSVKPHDDSAGWHARLTNCKVYVPIKANDKCVNTCEYESVIIKTGEAMTFNNLLTHSVRNDGDCDRLTAIICMRTET